MTTLKCSILALCIVLSHALLCRAQEQPAPSVEVAAGPTSVTFSAGGDIRQLRVEVFTPAGARVFEADSAAGQPVEWDMRDASGARVPEGTYRAAITVTDFNGKRSRRTEWVTVVGEEPQAVAAAPAPGDANAPTGSGTAGRLAKWTSASALGNSVVTESAGKISIAQTPVTPAATLDVRNNQPAASANNGVNATQVLRVQGGKGGNTTGSSTTGGAGASILLAAGDGGDTSGGGSGGTGGSITLRPGAKGTGGGFTAFSGKVLIAPTNGLVGIGTNSPNAKLDITAAAGVTDSGILSGVLQVTNTDVSPGNSPAIVAINNNGTAVRGTSQTGHGVSGSSNSDDGVSGTSNSGDGVSGISADGIGVRGESTKNNYGVFGKSFFGTAVYGESTNFTGVHGKSNAYFGTGVFGEGVKGVSGTSASSSLLDAGVFGKNTGGGYGVQGISTNGVGVRGEGATGVQGISSGTGIAVFGQNPDSGYAGQFSGKTKFTANMEIDGNELFGNVTRQMINLYNLDYGIGIQAATLYFRVANTGGYNWYMGGMHSNTKNSPGTGGVSLMRLDSSGNLFVKGAVTATNISNPSDRALKSNFASVNPRAVLDRLAAVPVQTWNYKSEGEEVRHMGPMAQDFKAAFDLGTDDKTISTVDSAGVTMAAIQGLYQMMLDKDRQIASQGSQIESLTRMVERQQAQLNQVRRTMKRRRAAKK